MIANLENFVSPIDPDLLPEGMSLADGRLRIDYLLARGGMSTVYVARNEAGQAVALKVMASRYAANEDSQKRFEREAEFTRTLADLPFVVHVRELGRCDELAGRMYMTMELVEVETLSFTIGGRPMAPLLACQIVHAVASALRLIHGRGVIHRDVKPSNILVELTNGRVQIWLLDFGIAYALAAAVPGTVGLTRIEERPGTEEYMAPEQAVGLPPAPSFDVYALAATLFEALTGCIPYFGHPRGEMIRRKCDARFPEPSLANFPDMAGRWPASLVALVEHGLAREAERRVPSAAAFEEGLAAVIAELEGAAGDRGVVRTIEPRAIPVLTVAPRQQRADPERHVDVTELGPRTGAIEVPERARARSGDTQVVVELPRGLTQVVECGALPKISLPALEPAEALTRAELLLQIHASEREAVDDEIGVAGTSRSRSRVMIGVGVGVAAIAGVALLWVAGIFGGDARVSSAREPAAAGIFAADGADGGVVAVPARPVVPGPDVEPTPIEPTPIEPTRIEPTPRPPPKPAATPERPESPTAPPSAACATTREAAALAHRRGDFNGALEHLEARGCWADRRAHTRLLVSSLAQSGAFRRCVAVAKGSSDPAVRDDAETCRLMLEEE